MGLKEDMIGMGFGENRAARALQAVHYESLERAIAWLECHENDPDIDDPVTESAGNVLGSAADTTEQSGLGEEVPTMLTDEERAEKLAATKARIAAKRAEVEQKDKEDAVMREKIRRKDGQSLGEMREKVQRDEMQKAAEDRRKQKIADAQSKKAILEEIARDRAAKKAAQSGAVPVQPAQPATPAQPAPVRNYNDCRLQLRLPTGQPLINTFQAEDTLGDVVAFIRDTAGLESISLMTSFPRRQFPQSDYALSLKSLGLCPSSVIIVSKCQ